jgi:hypothetical protein
MWDTVGVPPVGFGVSVGPGAKMVYESTEGPIDREARFEGREP